MKIQRYEKLIESDPPKCEAKTVYQQNNQQCEFKASYVIGEKLLCKKHAANECLEIVLEGFNDAVNGKDYHEDFK